MKDHKALWEGQAVVHVRVEFRGICVHVFKGDSSFIHCHHSASQQAAWSRNRPQR